MRTPFARDVPGSARSWAGHGQAAAEADAVAIALTLVFGFVNLFQLQLILRIERLRTAASGLGRNGVPIDILFQIGIRAGKMMRNRAGRSRYLRYVLAGEETGALSGIQEPALAADERFRQDGRARAQ